MSNILLTADALRLAINVLRDSVECRRMPSGVELNDACVNLHLDASDALEQCLTDLTADVNGLPN